MAWVLGGRDDAACRRLPEGLCHGRLGRLPPGGSIDQVFTVKRLALPIRRDNSNARHGPARFRRRTKVVSKCQTMIGLSLRLLHPLQDSARHAAYAKRLQLSSVGTLSEYWFLIVRGNLWARFGIVMHQLI